MASTSTTPTTPRSVAAARNIQYYFSVQNRGLRTYYVNSQGDMLYIRPSTLLEARWRSRHFPLEDYNYETLRTEPLRLAS